MGLNELDGLIPTHLSTRSQLNEWERQNIESALIWLAKLRQHQPLDALWLCRLHREMFGKTWRWAGTFRRTNKSIGVDWRQIRMQLPALLADINYQVKQQVAGPDRIAVSFHDRLVAIHPFPNGNGRHARLMADVLIEQLGQPRFSWRQHMLKELLNSEQHCTAAIIKERLGLVIPWPHPLVAPCCHWGPNYGRTKLMLGHLGVELKRYHPLSFPAGSFFWCAGATLKPLLELGLKIDNFAAKPIGQDGFLSHVLERCFGFLRWITNQSIAVMASTEHKSFKIVRLPNPFSKNINLLMR